MAIDDQLASLLAQNADLFASYEDWSNAQVMLLAGSITDPTSFNAQGGKTGALGYYPVINVSGQTIYVPCMDRLKHAAIDGVNDALDAVSIVGDGLLRSTGSINEELRLDVAAASVADTIAGTRTDAAVTPAGSKAAIDQSTGALALLTDYALAQRLTVISSFADAPNRMISVGTRRVKMQNNGAEYIYDAAIDAAYVALNPRASFVTQNGLGFRIDPSVPQDPLMHGAIGMSVNAFGPPPDDTAALKSLFKNCDYVDMGMKGQTWLCTSPIQGRSGQQVSGSGKLYRLNHLDHIITLIDVDGFQLTGVELSHNFPGGAVARSNKSCVYGLRSRNVKIYNAFFRDTALFAVSSDESGPGWLVCLNDFRRVAGTCVDLRGREADGSGKGFQVCLNYVETTGDDAFAVAYFSQAGIVANNIIFNPGQYVTYDEVADGSLVQAGGGGIRFNGRQSVVDNQIFNANLFFIAAATYSRNLAAAPNQALISGNIGRGIKPTINNTTACVLVKSVESLTIGINDFDAVGDNVFTIQSIGDNGAGKVRIVTTAPHGFYVNNQVRFENAAGKGSVSAVTAVLDANTMDLATTWVAAAYGGATTCFPAVNGLRVYTDTRQVQSVTDNGSGKVRVTLVPIAAGGTVANAYETGMTIRLVDAGGITNGASPITLISANVFDMTGLAYTGAYTTGGSTYDVASRSRSVKLRGPSFRNIETTISCRGGGAAILDIEDVEAINYTYFFGPAQNPQITELKLNKITCRNPRTVSGTDATSGLALPLTGALFYGGGAINFVTGGKIEINENEVIPGAFGMFNAPIDFTNMVATRAEALGNKLGGATNSFLAAGNIPMFLFDGDWSETMHAAGTVTIAAGQTTSGAIVHGLPRNPRISSFSLQKTSAGSAPGGGSLYIEYITSTNYVIRCDTAPTAALTVSWRINPMPRPYINNATGA